MASPTLLRGCYDPALVKPRAPTTMNVAAMSGPERFAVALGKTPALVPLAMKEQVRAMVSPAGVAALSVALAAWAASHYFGVGFILDLMVVVGIGLTCLPLAWELMQAGFVLNRATTEGQLDEAAQHLANAIALVGVSAFTALVFAGAGKAAAGASAAVRTAANAGMTLRHYQAFKSVARTMNRIIAVRNTNPLSLNWIRRGFPAKPLGVNWHTSKSTGIVTVSTQKEAEAARQMGYYVVDADNLPKNLQGNVLKFDKSPDWPLEPGQIIDPDVAKPLVGDYDLLDVIDPKAMDELIVVWSEGGQPLLNKTSPEIEQVADAVNRLIGIRARVMHGPFAAVYDVTKAGDSLFFFPDGSVVPFTVAEIKAMYLAVGRKVVPIHR